MIHFYHLHALDWVDIPSALKADPAKRLALAQSISDCPNSGATYFTAVLNRLKTLADSGQLTLFANGYWGHPAYRLPPEENLLAVAHYLEALEWQRDVIRIHAVLGGKNPHPQTFLVGGMATPIDPNSPQAINPERITFLRERLHDDAHVRRAGLHPGRAARRLGLPGLGGIGGGHAELPDLRRLRTGAISDTGVVPVPARDHHGPRPHHASCRRSGEDHRAGGALLVHLRARATRGAAPLPGRDGPQLHRARSRRISGCDTDSKYSWLKAPRYDGEVMEVGPLARAAGRLRRRRAGGQAGGRRAP